MKRTGLLLLLLGCVSIIGQTVLLRELLIEVRGNEIVFAIYLSLWLFLVSIGSLIAKYFLGKKQLDRIITAIFIMLCFIIPAQFLSITHLVKAFAIVSGEMINIPGLFLTAFIVLLPGSLLTGFLFPLLCKQLPSRKQPVHLGYILECSGIICGGILLAIGIHFLPHFSILIILNIIILSIVFYVFRRKYIIIFLLLFCLFMPFSGRFFQEIYAKKYEPQELLLTGDSRYGRLDITSSNLQKNYYWNGELFANSQNDIYAQQLVHFVMLQHPAPQNILLVGGLLNGFIDEIELYPAVSQIDYLELDKNITRQAKSDSLVNYIYKDVVDYLNSTDKKYDLILIDVPDPSSLNLNRFYTEDFFELIKSRMSVDSSVAAITLSSGTNFMTPDIEELNATVYHTFSRSFPNVILIPSVKNIFIGSSNDFISNNVEILSSRILRKRTWFNETVIFEKCNELRKKQMISAITKKAPQINNLGNPVAYLATLRMWTRKLGIRSDKYIEFIKKHFILSFICVFAVLMFTSMLASTISRSRLFRTDFSIFIVSLVNFVMQLILINLFQVHFGFAFWAVFIFTSVFMLGLTAGFIAGKALTVPLKILLMLNALLIGLLILVFDSKLFLITYFGFNFLFAFMEGAVLSILLKRKFKKEKISSSSTFYFLDSLGATTGGLLVGVIIIPVFGLKSSLLFLSFLLGVIFISSFIRVRKSA
jgi:spermidine synthase